MFGWARRPWLRFLSKHTSCPSQACGGSSLCCCCSLRSFLSRLCLPFSPGVQTLTWSCRMCPECAKRGPSTNFHFRKCRWELQRRSPAPLTGAAPAQTQPRPPPHRRCVAVYICRPGSLNKGKAGTRGERSPTTPTFPASPPRSGSEVQSARCHVNRSPEVVLRWGWGGGESH